MFVRSKFLVTFSGVVPGIRIFVPSSLKGTYSLLAIACWFRSIRIERCSRQSGFEQPPKKKGKKETGTKKPNRGDVMSSRNG